MTTSKSKHTTGAASRRNIFELNYSHLEKLLGQPPEEFSPGSVCRLQSKPYMDLVVEGISPCHGIDVPVLSIAHYFTLEGDLCQDPEITIRVFAPGTSGFQELAPSSDVRHGRVEVLSFQQAIPPVYQDVYPEPGRHRPRLKGALNRFFADWLRNLKLQGHRRISGE